MRVLCDELQARLARAREGGGAAALERHRGRGKLPVRERIDLLLDPDTAWLELSPLAAFGLYDDEAPARRASSPASARVHGRECVIVANDATVKGGTYFPLTVKKHLRAQEIALENRLPCIYLVDSGGAYLPLQAEVFPDRDHFGRIFYNQARMSAEGIPQLAAVMGSCTAGGAYVPAMCDQSVIVQGTGTIFLAGPPLVKAATGEEVTAEELGGADVHARISGVADALASSDEHALALLREAVAGLGAPGRALARAAGARGAGLRSRRARGRHPRRRAHALRRARGDRPARRRLALRRVQAALRRHARVRLRAHLGLSRWRSWPTTASSSPSRRSRARTSSSWPASGASRWSSCRTSPASWSARRYEHGGIAKDGAKLVMAVACAQVPKLTVVIGGSYGAGNYGMCGRAFGPRFLFMWPNARIAVMGPRQAAETLLTVRLDALRARGEEMDEAAREAFVQPIVERYEHRERRQLLERAPVGRRRDRAARHAARARARPGRRRARAHPRAALRRLPDVSGLAIERDGGVARVWLDRPERRNAFDAELIEAVHEAFASFAADDSPARRRAGWTGRRRSAPGADLDWMRASAELTHERNVADAERAAAMFAAVDSCPVPVVARVHGAALGGGTGLACCCDIVLAREDARFGFTEVRLGLIPATIGPFALARIGRSQARALFLTGELLRRPPRARDRHRARGARRRRGARRGRRAHARRGAARRPRGGARRQGPDRGTCTTATRRRSRSARPRRSPSGASPTRGARASPPSSSAGSPTGEPALRVRGDRLPRRDRPARHPRLPRARRPQPRAGRGRRARRDRRARGGRGGRGPVLPRCRHARPHGGGRRRAGAASGLRLPRPSRPRWPRPAAPPASRSWALPPTRSPRSGARTRRASSRSEPACRSFPAAPTPRDLGYPLLVKARAGGGGRGMRVVRDAAELADVRRGRGARGRGGLRRPRPAATSATSTAHGTSRCRSCATPTAAGCTSASATARCSGATRR